jgi:hypothetical protein
MNMLFTPGMPAFYLMGIDNRTFEQVYADLQDVDPMTNVLLMYGWRCRTRAGFFKEITETLRIPMDLELNWQRLTNALVDLTWLGGTSFLILVNDAPLFLSEDRTDMALRACLQVLNTANEAWAEQYHMGVNGQPKPTAFNVLFGCLEPEIPAFTNRVAQAGGVIASISDLTIH